MIGTNAIADISHFQGFPDFGKAAAAGIVAVIHKATQGVTNVDPNFAKNRAAIQAAGLLFGAYHFGSPGDGVAQARHFLATATPQPGDLLVLDFEPPGSGAGMDPHQALAFLQDVESQTGVLPGLYGPAGYLSTNAALVPDLANCWLWLAQYNSKITSPTVPAPWSDWTLWQYTDGTAGSEPVPVDGIGKCDRDTFNGTADELPEFWEGNSVPPAGSGS